MKSIAFFLLLTFVTVGLYFGQGTSKASPIPPVKMAAPVDSSIDWEHMSHSERKQYMKDVVLPKMKPILENFDKKLFPDVKCVTCHGNGARTGEYKMPNPQLPKLPDSPEGFKKLREKEPKVMEFMSKTMKPTMAGLLGMKPFDRENPKGFGCENCHTSKKSK